MDLSFTPLQDELRAQARAFLEATPEPTWAQLAELGWTGASVRRSTAARARLPRGGRAARGGRARAAPRAALVDVVASLPFLPGDDQAAVAAGETSWTLALGPLVPDLDTATSVASSEATRSGSSTAPSARCSRRATRRGRSAWSRVARPGASCARRTCCRRSARARSRCSRSRPSASGRGRSSWRRVRRRAGAVRPPDRLVPGRRAPARELARGARARAVARVVGGVVRRQRRRAEPHVAAAAAKAAASDAAVARVRARDPGARRDRLHLGARAAPALQARALDPVLGGVPGAAARRGRGHPARRRRRSDLMARALMMDYQLNVPAILRRAEELYGDREIVSRLPDKSWHRYTYADFTSRTKRLAVALRGLGLEDGDRVATLMWNHHEHLETYIGAPVGGFVTHTLNLRLHPDDNTYIATHAGDRVLVVDKVLWPLAAQFVERVGFEHVIAVGAGETPGRSDRLRGAVAGRDESAFSYRDIDERAAAAMCFTSGTTGRPKGVVYSHRAIAIHALTAGGLLGHDEADTVLPVVPMFHANAWCFPFTCTLVGAKQVFPGPHLDPESLLEAFEQERVTVSAGRAHDLDGHPAGARREPERLGPLRDAHDDGRRRRAAARDDRGVRRAARPAHHPRLGHDRDVPDRDDLGRPRPGAGAHRRRARTTSGRSRGRRSRSSRSALAARKGSCRGTARPWASSRCAGRRSLVVLRLARERRPLDGRRLVQDRATSSRSTRTATSRCRTGPRTSSSRAASGSRPSRSRTR